MAAGGKSAAEIGKALNIASGTVKRHLHVAYQKLGIAGTRASVTLMLRGKELLGK